MDAPHTPMQAGASELAPVHDRSEGQPFWYVVWPLGMVALILALLVDSCAPRMAASSSFDAAAAVKTINDRVGSVLETVPRDAQISEVISLLNLMVIAFKPGSDVVPQNAYSALESMAKVIDQFPPEVKVTIVGHADRVDDNGSALTVETSQTRTETADAGDIEGLGAADSSTQPSPESLADHMSSLAVRRAQAVRLVLIGLGVPEYQLNATAANSEPTKAQMAEGLQDLVTRHIGFTEPTPEPQ